MNSLIYRMTQQYFTKEIYYVAAMVCLASKYKKVRKLRTKHNHSLPEKFSRIPIHACSNLHTQKIVRGNGIYAATYVSRTHVQARAHKHISTGYARVPFSRVCSSARSLACLPSALNSVCISLCGSWRFRAWELSGSEVPWFLVATCPRAVLWIRLPTLFPRPPFSPFFSHLFLPRRARFTTLREAITPCLATRDNLRPRWGRNRYVGPCPNIHCAVDRIASVVTHQLMSR